MGFEKNVFINCPFDKAYYPILRAILFTLSYLGFEPKISETSDSGFHRLGKIKKLIETSKYSIHDISRIQLNDKGYPRFNMPFECGIDFGCKLFGSKRAPQKRTLILEKERYRYQEFLSDISGNDIKAHKNDPELVVKAIRDWFRVTLKQDLAWSTKIWMAYTEFEADYTQVLKAQKINPDEIGAITFSDLIQLTKDWVEKH